MKLRPIIAASVLLAAFAASALPVSASQENTAAAIEAGKKIAAENSIGIQSDEAAIALDVISSANDGALPVLALNDDHSIRTLSGIISDRTIRNEKDAAAVMKRLAPIFGVEEAGTDLVFDACQSSTLNDVYIFDQVYQGVRVESGCISLVVSKETGKANYVTNTFASDLALDVTPVITAEQAGRIIANEFGEAEFSAPELVIRRTDNGTFRLAWTAHSDVSGVYVDAKDGEIMRVVDPNGVTYKHVAYKYKTSAENPVTKKKSFTINLEDYVAGPQYYNQGYRLHDTKRHIWVLGDQNCNDAYMYNDWEEMGESYIRSNPFYFEQNHMDWMNNYVAKFHNRDLTQTDSDQVLAGVMYQVERVYDFYDFCFNWKGPNNSDAALIVNGQNRYGSLASPYGSYIGIGMGSPYSEETISNASALDCVGHEYTHLVTNAKVKWGMSNHQGETGCLNEGYSDIMGEYIEHDTTWKIGTDAFTDGSCLRDASYEGGTYYGDQLYQYTNANHMSTVECHSGSTILSHCAYLMHKYQIPDFLAAEIWYNSMDYLPKGTDAAKFIDCRNALHFAADPTIGRYYSGNMKMNYMAKVLMAFNAVNVKCPTYKMGDANMDGYVNRTDINYINQYYRGDRTLSWFATTLADVNYDGKVTTADSDVIARAISYGRQNNL